MHLSRRKWLQAAGLASLSAAWGTPVLAARGTANSAVDGRMAPASAFGITPNTDKDLTQVLQAAIDQTTDRDIALALPPGRFNCRTLTLRPRTAIVGSGDATRLHHIGSGPLIQSDRASHIRLRALHVDGDARAAGDREHAGLVHIDGVDRVDLANLTIRAASGNGLTLVRCGGRVTATIIRDVGQAGLFSLNSTGLQIDHNTISLCANNGIQVWQSKPGHDGSQILNNRIDSIKSAAGGTGQNGNGINVYRAGTVTVMGNLITDCAYSAVRGNAASNLQIIANQASRIGEVALYSEFGFQGVVMASNTVDTAATGISVTNFNEGGRLAVIQGNLIRNLFRREFEPVDKRGNGIAVEADAAVSGNVIEGAPTAGIWIGWGRHMRNVAATGNVVRDCGIGIVVSDDIAAGAALIANNIIDRAASGAIRRARLGAPYGPDLIAGEDTGNIRVTGNIAN